MCQEALTTMHGSSALAAARPLLGGMAIDYLPRLLGLGDRDPTSATFGCFDRTYWHYRLLDVANARYQEAGLAMALAYQLELDANPYRGRSIMIDWARAAAECWVRNQHRDGSVHEVYPYERSFCATSFSTWATAETASRLADKTDWNFLATPLARAARWLQANESPLVANQRAAAALALITVGQWLHDDDLVRAGADVRRRLLESESSEGFFPEYGGGDIGYQSLTLSCLVQSALKTRQEPILDHESVAGAVAWLDRRVGPEGRCDIRGTSRGTQWLYPLALVFCGCPAGTRLLDGLRARRAISPAWLDDRYSIGLAIDYLLTASLPEDSPCS